jgi:hypothetical protein
MLFESRNDRHLTHAFGCGCGVDTAERLKSGIDYQKDRAEAQSVDESIEPGIETEAVDLARNDRGKHAVSRRGEFADRSDVDLPRHQE